MYKYEVLTAFFPRIKKKPRKKRSEKKSGITGRVHEKFARFMKNLEELRKFKKNLEELGRLGKNQEESGRISKNLEDLGRFKKNLKN